MSDAGQSAMARAFGAFPSHMTEETYYISVGTTVAGNEARDKREQELRSTVVVPDHYGDVVAVTPAQGAVIVWYQDVEGVVRNVILYTPEALLYRLEPRPATRREVRLR
jgi:hypothetical protein